jgi:NADPH2:quinone reductase
VIDYHQSLALQVQALRFGAPGFVFSTTQTDQHLADIVKLIAPQGRFGLIDDPQELDIKPFKRKAISLHWEFMFTRSMFDTPDIEEQGKLLNDLAALIDAGHIYSTATEVAGEINAAALRAVHAQIESGSTRGKIILEGF